MNDTDTLDAHALPDSARQTRFPDLAGKVVFITGGGSGIGLSMAEAFALNGARLALLDINPAALAAARQQLLASHPQLEIDTCTASITDDVAVEAAVAQAEARFGRIDVLLNNAGISMNRPTMELPAADWRRAIDINLNGVFYCAQSVGRRMVRQGAGVILNTASMYGVVAAPERAAYCASKAAVVMLTKVMAIEWARAGVRVNALAPGYIQTPLVDELVRDGRMDLEALTRRTPSGRLGQPHEIATLALFLASDGAAFINGQAIVADGGWSSYSYI
jgi:NAD(P)-dependent dehydrogenase (short-subunit alcohol dehydrogenase family)